MSDTKKPSFDMRKTIRESVDSGLKRGASELADKSRPTSMRSGKRAGSSKEPWLQPRNAKQFAGQANRVATMVLEGTIDLEIARVYSSIARTVSQSMSTEVQRARLTAGIPDLDFEDPEP